MTNDFLRSRPDEWDLIERLFTRDSIENELDEMSLEEYQAFTIFVNEEVKRLKGASYSEILMLLDLLHEHEEAVAYDCICVGLRLRDVGTEDFTWGDLLAIVRQSPRSSALFRSLYPDEAVWAHQEQLLATIADALHVGNWQRGQGNKKDYPKPIPRPGVKPESEKFGKDAVTLDEISSWLGWEC
ncbi:hypothetical protein [Streptomyces sp. NPDC005385]|uniref:hypothetical protein n=1 Tax=Streptomyces sp. NPDC005385 TaxID=3157039 RepID=UPI0033A05835